MTPTPMDPTAHNSVRISGEPHDVEVARTGTGELAIRVGDTATRIPATDMEAVLSAPGAGSVCAETSEGCSGTVVRAPMPGRILAVDCSVGAKVAKGDRLIVLEAMKMENEICAPASGTLRELRIRVGDRVRTGQVLAAIDPQDEM